MKTLILIASLALMRIAVAAEAVSSTTPYQALYQVLAPVAQINQYDRLVALQHIESKLDGVHPSDIHIVIRAKSGAIPVTVGAEGDVAFPVTDALRDENPLVETNQPKGSLALIVNVALRNAERLRVPWSDIEAALTQVKAFYAQSRGATAPAISGIEVHFAPGAAAMLTIEGKSERLLMADPHGRLVVTREMALEDGAPVLGFSRAPDYVLPYSDPPRNDANP